MSEQASDQNIAGDDRTGEDGIRGVIDPANVSDHITKERIRLWSREEPIDEPLLLSMVLTCNDLFQVNRSKVSACWWR